LAPRDMYADLEKIEARGKRKKEKSKGLFSSFGKKESEESQPAESAPVPTPEPSQPAAQPEPVPQPKPVPPPAQSVHPKPAPTPVQSVHTKPAVEHIAESSWKPLTGGKLEKANEDLLAYKKWLNKGYKSGVLTKEQCVTMVKAKEIELGLRPPE